MFERFTDRARHVVVVAQEEARLLNHNYIGTEHLLLGLAHETEGIGAKALERLGVSLEAVRVRVEEIIGRGESEPSGQIPFTPRAKKVLELSLREALQLGHNYIGTEHILLGLVREGEGVAAQVLANLGVQLQQVRHEVIQLISGYAPPPRQVAGTEPVDTPAALRAQEEARRLAGEGPVGTQHVLSAILRDEESLGAKALAALGVTAEAVAAQLARLDLADTSDELPEEAGARHTTVEIIGGRVGAFVEDDELRERLARALPGEKKVLHGTDPAAVSFPGLWRDLKRHLDAVAWHAEHAAAERWRPPEWDRGWDVGAYAVIQGPGGMTGILEVAEGIDPQDVRARLADWLIAHPPLDEGGVTYLAILIGTSESGDRSYQLFSGVRPDWPRAQPQFLVAHAILDLTQASKGP